MFLYGPLQEHQDLGFDPISAIITGATLKNIFGIGAKKRAFKDMEAQAKGQWVAQYPSNIDWNEYLNKKFGGVVGQTYKKERGRKDSMLLKQNIATPEDFAAWHLSEYGLRDGDSWKAHCDTESRNPNSNGYKWCPVDKESQINIFDTPRIQDWYTKNKPGAFDPQPVTPASTPKAPPLEKQPTTQPTTQTLPANNEPGTLEKILAAISQNLPQNDPAMNFMPQAPVVVQQPEQKELPQWVLPAIIGTVALGAVFVMTQKKGRR